MSVKKDIKKLFKHVDLLAARLDASKIPPIKVKPQSNSRINIVWGLTLDEWGYIKQNEYLCGFSNKSFADAYSNSKCNPSVLVDFGIDGRDITFFSHGDIHYKYCWVRGEYGEKQPWFGEGMQNALDHSFVVVKLKDGTILSAHSVNEFDWNWVDEDDVDIVEFTLYK